MWLSNRGHHTVWPKDPRLQECDFHKHPTWTHILNSQPRIGCTYLSIGNNNTTSSTYYRLTWYTLDYMCTGRVQVLCLSLTVHLMPTRRKLKYATGSILTKAHVFSCHLSTNFLGNYFAPNETVPFSKRFPALLFQFIQVLSSASTTTTFSFEITSIAIKTHRMKKIVVSFIGSIPFRIVYWLVATIGKPPSRQLPNSPTGLWF